MTQCVVHREAAPWDVILRGKNVIILWNRLINIQALKVAAEGFLICVLLVIMQHLEQ